MRQTLLSHWYHSQVGTSVHIQYFSKGTDRDLWKTRVKVMVLMECFWENEEVQDLRRQSEMISFIYSSRPSLLLFTQQHSNFSNWSSMTFHWILHFSLFSDERLLPSKTLEAWTNIGSQSTKLSGFFFIIFLHLFSKCLLEGSNWWLPPSVSVSSSRSWFRAERPHSSSLGPFSPLRYRRDIFFLLHWRNETNILLLQLSRVVPESAVMIQ